MQIRESLNQENDDVEEQKNQVAECQQILVNFSFERVDKHQVKKEQTSRENRGEDLEKRGKQEHSHDEQKTVHHEYWVEQTMTQALLAVHWLK